MNDLRAMLRRISLFVFTSFLALNSDNRAYFQSVYQKIGIDLCKVLLKAVQSQQVNSHIIKPPTFSYLVFVAPSLRSEYFPGYKVQDFRKPPPPHPPYVVTPLLRFLTKVFLHSITGPQIFRCHLWQLSHLLLLVLFQSLYRIPLHHF